MSKSVVNKYLKTERPKIKIKKDKEYKRKIMKEFIYICLHQQPRCLTSTTAIKKNKPTAFEKYGRSEQTQCKNKRKRCDHDLHTV